MRIGIYSVLAASKRAGAPPLLTHAAIEGETAALEPLCDRVKGEHLTQDGTEPAEPSCLKCQRELRTLRPLLRRPEA